MLTVNAKTARSGDIQFTVTTNLPTPLSAMASLDLQGLEPHDVAIGTTKSVTLTGPSTTFLLRAINDANAFDGKPLPDGSYDAEVLVGPKWTENKSIASLGSNLEAKQTVEIRSGRSQVIVKRTDELQRWVMMNVNKNSPWNELRYVGKLGHYEKIPLAAPSTADADYFPDADLTLIVNRPAERVIIWRMGRTTK